MNAHIVHQAGGTTSLRLERAATPWARLRGLLGLLQRHRIGVAHRHHLRVGRVLAQGVEVVLRDAPAAHQGKTQLAVGDGGAVDVHGCGRLQIIAEAPAPARPTPPQRERMPRIPGSTSPPLP